MDINYSSIMKKALLTLTLMFGLLFAVATAMLWYLEMPINHAVAAAVIITLLQYVLAPLIIPMFYDIEFVDINISSDTWQKIYDLCKKAGVKTPRIGIIKDGNPNAFVYGYHRGFAWLIVTQGLFEKLTEEEFEAVIAHELGHIKHNDFVLMMIVSFIPMAMYQIYSWTNRNSKSNPAYWVGLGAYAAYVVSQFFALSFSRVREYYADSFSRKTMEGGEYLKNALIKIAYGYTALEEKRSRKAIAFGISNNLQDESFVLTQYKGLTSGELEEKLIAWDMKSLWGRWYELNSTHPLTAKRILALEGKSSKSYPISKAEIGRFFTEAIIWLLPWGSACYIYLINKSYLFGSRFFPAVWGLIKAEPQYLLLLGMAILVKYFYSHGKNHQNYKLEELLSREDASPVKGMPAVIEGKIIGKGIPGYFFGEDLIIDDGTSIMLIDYKQPLRIMEIIFGLDTAERLRDKDVKVAGWYKRGNRPYFQCRHIFVDDKKLISFNYILTELLGYVLIAAGIIMYLIKLFIY